MKKYCIVSFGNLYNNPYSVAYVDLIKKNHNICELLLWDRDGLNGCKDSFLKCEMTVFNKRMDPQIGKFLKILNYISAIRFFSKHIKNKRFDGLIFLQTHASVFCYHILRKHYRKKYIIDIRDYTLEHNFLYFNQEKRAINNAFATFISSEAYKRFLPEGDYILAHNYSPFEEEVKSKVNSEIASRQKGPVRISFIGTIRFFDINKKILSVFANDTRFQLNYYGNGSEVLKQYCEENGIKNVDFYGRFPPKMIGDFYLKTDLINNVYGNNNRYLDCALSNKLYHSAQLYIPILVSPGTFMEDMIKKYNLGFSVEINDKTMKDQLFDWFYSFDRRQFKSGCDTFINKVIADNLVYLKIVDEFVK